MNAKRILSLVLAVMMIATCFVVTSSAATTSGIWTYEDAGRGDGSIMITGCSQVGGALTVPATIDGKTVYGIAANVCWDATLDSVVVSEGIQYIGEYAFGWHINTMTSVSLPSTLTTMAKGAFVAPFVLGSVDIPAACVNFPDAVESNPKNLAFGSFFGIGQSVGGATVTVHTEEAKAYFEEVAASMAANQYNTLTVNYVPVSTVVPDGTSGVFSYTDAGRGDGSIMLTACSQSGGALTVPATLDGHPVYGIAQDFAWNALYSSVTIEEGIQYIAPGAFGWFLTDFVSVSLPSTLTTLGHGAFVAPFVLGSVDIPAACVNFPTDYSGEHEGLVKLGSFFGMNYSNGTSATVTVHTEAAQTYFEEISAHMAKEGYPALNVVLQTVQTDGHEWTGQMIDGKYYLTDCDNGSVNLGKVVVPATWQGNQVYGIADGALFNRGITSLTISEGIEYIGQWACAWNPTEMVSLSLPSTLTTICNNAFALDYSLAEVYIPEACVNFPTDASVPCPINNKTLDVGPFYDGRDPGTGEGKVIHVYTAAAYDALNAFNALNTSNGSIEYTLVKEYQDVETKQGGQRVGGLNPSYTWSTSDFVVGYESGMDQAGTHSHVQDVTASISDDYTTLTVVANVFDDMVYPEIKDGEPWLSECFEVLVDPLNGHLASMTEATDRSDLIQARISRGADGAMLTGRWLAQTNDTPTADSLFDGKFTGTLVRNDATNIDTYTFTLNLSEFNLAKGSDIALNFVSQSCLGAANNWGTTYYQLIRANGTYGTWDAENWDYWMLGEDIGTDGEIEKSQFVVSYDKADTDTDVTLSAYNGNVTTVVVPAQWTCDFNDGSSAARNFTILATGAFNGEPYIETLDFEATVTDTDTWKYVFPIFQSNSIVNNPNLTTLSIPSGTRVFSSSNWNNGWTDMANWLGYNNAIHSNPNLTNINVPSGNRFGLYSIDGVLVTWNMMADNKVTLVHWPEGRLGQQALDPTIKAIYANAFINDTETMGDYTNRALYLDASSVETVYDYAFNNATALKSIDLRSCTSISSLAFDNISADQRATIVIKGYANSYIETFANENGFAFEAVTCAHETTHEELKADGNGCEYNVVCDTCGEVVEVVEHHSDEWTIVTELVEATCTEDGLAIAVCSVCGGNTNDSYVIPALGHDYVTTTVDPTETEQGYDEHVCSRCGDTYKDNYTDPTGPAAPVETVVGFSRNLQLLNCIDFNVIVKADQLPAGATDFRMEVAREIDGVVGDYAAVELNTDNTTATHLYYRVSGIAAAWMTNEIHAKFYFTVGGVDYVSQEYVTSVENYAIAMLGVSAYPKLNTLLVDMLNYGATAQTAFDVKTETLANANLTEAQKALGTQDAPAMTNIAKSEGSGLAVSNSVATTDKIRLSFVLKSADVASAGIDIDQVVFKLTRADYGTTVEVSDYSIVNGNYYFYYDELATAQFGVAVTGAAYIGEEKISVDKTMSVESYLAVMTSYGSSVPNYDLYVNMMKYSNAAKAYFG